MSGNVAEFCLDCYSPDAYKADSVTVNPKGPAMGQEHVIRGGSFKSDAKDVRSAARDFTKTKAWLVTDPRCRKVYGGIPIVSMLDSGWYVKQTV